jgi:hypothetical protein
MESTPVTESAAVVEAVALVVANLVATVEASEATTVLNPLAVNEPGVLTEDHKWWAAGL